MTEDERKLLLAVAAVIVIRAIAEDDEETQVFMHPAVKPFVDLVIKYAKDDSR